MKKLAPALLLLAACPGPDPARNPERLYLNLDGSETMVRLTEFEPGRI